MNIRLLMDLRDIFEEEDRMTSEAILTALHKIEDAPWGDMNGIGRELTSRGLAQRLGTYGIKPHNIRIQGFVIKGYEREDLNDAWTRYLGLADTEPDDPYGKLRDEKEETEGTHGASASGVGEATYESATSATGATAGAPFEDGWKHRPCAKCGNLALTKDSNGLCQVCKLTASSRASSARAG